MTFECKRCGACCRRYWITLLPYEAEKQANLLGLERCSFIGKYCILCLQLFPAEYREGTLLVFNELLPKKLCKEIESRLGYLPEHFIVLPSIALRRMRGKCVFLDEESSSCRIYKARPGQCSLFPLISTKESADLSAEYRFCTGLKGTSPKKSAPEMRKQQQRVNSYFEAVKKKGFSKLWGCSPEKGVALFRGSKIAELSRREFMKSLGQFA